MMYTLTLSREERKAFDWVGGRYAATGDEMAYILCQCMGPDEEWIDDADITFRIPEHKAWEMAGLVESSRGAGYWPCFSKALADKMQTFIKSII